jgi:trehalose 6-phosphate phosphatase
VSESEPARRFQLHEGRLVVELRPDLGADKGTALETLAERLSLRGLLCLGDDVTDVDMFRVAERLRSQGLATVRIAVASAEAAPEVMEAADYALDGVEGVERLLGDIVKALP